MRVPYCCLSMLGWVALAASMVIFLGHVCALPAAGHADLVSATQGQSDIPGNEPHGLHIESCHHVITVSPPHQLISSADALPVPTVLTPAIATPLPVWEPAAVHLPLLFLLHVSFLI